MLGERSGGLVECLNCSSGSKGDGGEGVEGVRREIRGKGGWSRLDYESGAPKGFEGVEGKEMG